MASVESRYRTHRSGKSLFARNVWQSQMFFVDLQSRPTPSELEHRQDIEGKNM